MLILNKLMILISVVLLLLCILAPMRKVVVRKRSLIQKILSPHAVYGVLLLITSFIHGILSGKKTGMMTGKLAWLCLLLLLCLSVLKRKMKKERWILIHRGFTVGLCILIVIHIIHATIL